jgi:hypothetical protein
MDDGLFYAENDEGGKHQFDYGFVNDTTSFSTLHWLAYYNDHEAIKCILDWIGVNKGRGVSRKSNNSPEMEADVLSHIMIRTAFRNLTPLCIAGTMKHRKCLQVFIDYFSGHDLVIKDILL